MNYREVVYPNAERICGEACWIPHPVLLAEQEDLRDIVTAISGIWENKEALHHV